MCGRIHRPGVRGQRRRRAAVASPSASDATTANLVVLSSKGGTECPKSSTVTVQLTDLQEMQNHMRETIDQGLQDLQAKQGTGGLPPAPPSAQAPPATAAYAAAAPPPETNVSTEIAQADQHGDQAEKDVTAEAGQPDTGAPSPAPPRRRQLLRLLQRPRHPSNLDRPLTR